MQLNYGWILLFFASQLLNLLNFHIYFLSVCMLKGSWPKKEFKKESNV